MNTKIFYGQLILVVVGLGLITCIGINDIVEQSCFELSERYTTTADGLLKFSKGLTNNAESTKESVEIIKISPQKQFQTMDGFGFSLTGGSAQHLLQLSAEKRQTLLDELFGTDDNSIGISYLRISLGASDLDEKAFSYNDINPDSEDLMLEYFSLKEDENDLIPVLKEILAINPNIGIMASPWSPPAWMKTNKSTKGGSLKKEYFDTYAAYFVKYIKGMKARGINIDIVTVQNEPLHPGNNPSLYMSPEDQAVFVKNNLGPAFRAEAIATKIVIYDHNADRIDYPMAILDDTIARRYVDGSAFHLYGGEIDKLSALHDAHPDKNIYFTEQWIGAPGNFPEDFQWHIKNLIIGASRNWCKTVLEWNLCSNSALQPHTQGGCTKCLGALTIDGEEVTRNPAYYIIAHASKFVRPGSKRIFSSANAVLPNVAFITPENKIVLIVINDSGVDQSFNIAIDNEASNYLIEAGTTATYVFSK